MTTTGVARVATREEQRLARRERLIAATWLELAGFGYEGASVTRIAAAAGVTTGTIYSQFAHKADLVRAALGAVDPSAAWPEPQPQQPVEDYLRDIAAHALDASEQAPADALLLVQLQSRLLTMPAPDAEFAEVLATIIRGVHEALAERIRDAARGAGQTLSVDAAHLAFAFNAVLFAAGASLAHRPTLADRATTTGAVGALLRGITS